MGVVSFRSVVVEVEFDLCIPPIHRLGRHPDNEVRGHLAPHLGRVDIGHRLDVLEHIAPRRHLKLEPHPHAVATRTQKEPPQVAAV